MPVCFAVLNNLHKFLSYFVIKIFNGEILLSDVAGGLILASDNPLDFHDEIYFVLVIALNRVIASVHYLKY